MFTVAHLNPFSRGGPKVPKGRGLPGLAPSHMVLGSDQQLVGKGLCQKVIARILDYW